MSGEMQCMSVPCSFFQPCSGFLLCFLTFNAARVGIVVRHLLKLYEAQTKHYWVQGVGGSKWKWYYYFYFTFIVSYDVIKIYVLLRYSKANVLQSAAVIFSYFFPLPFFQAVLPFIAYFLFFSSVSCAFITPCPCIRSFFYFSQQASVL